MKTRRKIGIGVGAFAAIVYLLNASWIAVPPQGEMTLLSHRGVHQTYDLEGLTNETCTAERIHAPAHSYIENTLESFGAAIAYGADMIELDIHPTTDGEFAVFHDWTLNCRTDGTGKTRDHDMASLKTLDLGYGYTADGGQTFPFRGKHIGAMPTLAEVLSAYPNTDFMINIKSQSKKEARLLIDYVPPAEWPRLIVMGHESPISVFQDSRPDVFAISKQDIKACAKSYILIGWTGYVPKPCRKTVIAVPKNVRHFVWGWPHRFEARLQKHGSRSMLMGNFKDGNVAAVDTLEDLTAIPENHSGIIWTNKIEIIGPAARAKTNN